jgi:hypothetical protein
MDSSEYRELLREHRKDLSESEMDEMLQKSQKDFELLRERYPLSAGRLPEPHCIFCGVLAVDVPVDDLDSINRDVVDFPEISWLQDVRILFRLS